MSIATVSFKRKLILYHLFVYVNFRNTLYLRYGGRYSGGHSKRSLFFTPKNDKRAKLSPDADEMSDAWCQGLQCHTTKCTAHISNCIISLATMNFKMKRQSLLYDRKSPGTLVLIPKD